MKKLFLLFFLLVLYFAPFVVGKDLQIIDRYRHSDDRTPLFIVYRPVSNSNVMLRFDLQKAAVKIHRLYNLSSFRLAFSPFKPFQHLLVSEVTAWCQVGMCFTYNYTQATNQLDGRHLELLQLFFKSELDHQYSDLRFDAYLKKYFSGDAPSIIKHHLEVFLDWKKYLINYEHWPLETIFLSPNVSVQKK